MADPRRGRPNRAWRPGGALQRPHPHRLPPSSRRAGPLLAGGLLPPSPASARRRKGSMMPTIEQARRWYETAEPAHDFEHVLRVYRMAERLARAEGADLEIVRAAALLHDARGAESGSGSAREAHHLVSAEFAAEVLEAEGWSRARVQAVQHCIRAHRFRDDSEEPRTLEAKVLFDADKLDALGAIGAARAIAYASQNGQPWYTPPSERFLQTGQKEPDEPHSAYHEYLFKLRHLRERLFTKTAQAIAEERLRYLSDFFERLIAEWEGRR
ncbi:MAG: HD domain-containing protein [Anaerolineae bacterium]|nr:MAG: HD domain-containing protein [Anaerolineae bacterium]